MREVAEVTAGPCKGAKLIIGHAERSSACGKGGGEPFLIYTASGAPAPEADVYEGLGSCQEGVALLKQGTVFLLESKDHILTSILPKLLPGTSTSLATDTDYRSLLIPKKITTSAGVSLESKLAGPGAIDERLFDRGDAKKLSSSEEFGDIYLKGRRSFLVSKDFNVVELNLGLAEELPSYGYLGFLEDLNKKSENTKAKIATADLSPEESKKERWIVNQKHSFLAREYRNYVERTKKMNQEVGDHLEQSPHDDSGYKIATVLTFKEYFDSKPVLIKVDKLGRAQAFARLLHENPYWAEPLIYVYSQKVTNVKIGFGPEVDIAISRPQLLNTWEFETAPPNLLKMNGRHYKTLFWEGVTAPIPQMLEGWVVSPSQIPSLLDAELLARGLNPLEISDFKRYWVPRLSTSPYYRIEFLPDALVERLCPIVIVPKPDTLIRVHMRAYPLPQFEQITSPRKQKTRVRRGLTVVEWGGIFSSGSYR